MAIPPERIISFFGIFIFAGIAWALSTDRRRVNWHLVLGGIGLQVVIAIALFQVPAGTKAFLFLNDIVIKVMDCASAGSKFVFGNLADSSSGFILAFQAFPTIIFFSSLISILYFYNIMGRIVQVFAFLFTRLFRISGAEALTAASNIFMGVEASLTVKPYLPQMTRSELCVVLTVGMATVSANILGLYVFTLKPYFPQIAGHLMTASLLAAPAAIITAKLMVPEDGTPVTLGRSVPAYQEKDNSLFEAIINGATAGVKMVVGISALLIAVLGLVALLELMMGGFSLKNILGHIFYPLTWLTGVDHRDVGIVSQLIGERLIATEVAAYRDLAEHLAKGAIADWRSTVIAVYALCGFAHIASMAIFVGGTAALAPNQTGALSKVALRALVAANLACLMTAAVAGTFISQSTVQ